MTFKDKDAAFNHYRTASAEDIEKRAAEIGKLIDKDPNADITTRKRSATTTSSLLWNTGRHSTKRCSASP